MKKISVYLLGLLLLINYSFAKNEIVTKKITEKSASFIINTDTKRTVLILHPANDAAISAKDLPQNSIMQESVDISLIKPFKGNYYVVFDGMQSVIPLTLKGLQAKTQYILSVYKPDANGEPSVQHKFSTLAEEPTKQASGIAFRQPTESSIELIWVNGNGEKRIVVASKGKTIAALPEDGKEYSANAKFGANESKIGDNAFVVYSGTKNECKVDNLEPSTIYSFQVFELNGNVETANYITSTLSGNPRWKMTAIPAPELLPAKNVHEIGCVLSWKGSPNIQKYILDIAYDEKFTRFAEYYENADVGDITEIEVIDLDPNENWFVRVKAVGEGTQSEYSKTLKVKKGDK
ncbi:MAG TPA: fibronectin type III domain-containing protein [Candidatus Kapabacteria bacterium]|nr:fibronectin type III domain-containing protein [Candidatus Kapabacteria bacterium]HOM05309.1 fibronectin type III domain-containing protein [Candidatus Kapabacteria bacterium]HPU23965.1 fibronectin type III domain-containing protein [Candidatus Kapabacteria bacterium]